jgi:hypothetical protein
MSVGYCTYTTVRGKLFDCMCVCMYRVCICMYVCVCVWRLSPCMSVSSMKLAGSCLRRLFIISTWTCNGGIRWTGRAWSEYLQGNEVGVYRWTVRKIVLIKQCNGYGLNSRGTCRIQLLVLVNVAMSISPCSKPL